MFEAAVADPDTLAAVVDPATEVYEAEVDPGLNAWRTATGNVGDADDWFEGYRREVDARYPERIRPPVLVENWNFDDRTEVRRRLPRLAALYLTGEAEDD